MQTVGDLLTRLSDKSRAETEQAARQVGIDTSLPLVAVGANDSQFSITDVDVMTTTPFIDGKESEPVRSAVVSI